MVIRQRSQKTPGGDPALYGWIPAEITSVFQISWTASCMFLRNRPIQSSLQIPYRNIRTSTLVPYLAKPAIQVGCKMQEFDFSPYFQMCDQVAAASTVQEKLNLCENARSILKDFVSASIKMDGELPPCILFRDYAPMWYMRTGQWDNALNYINFCISCRAYYPSRGKQELAYFNAYRLSAETALAFLSQNPGFLQSKIYKQLGCSVNKDCLKDFLRYSSLIQKVPHGKTNKLYVIQQL